MGKPSISPITLKYLTVARRVTLSTEKPNLGLKENIL